VGAKLAAEEQGVLVSRTGSHAPHCASVTVQTVPIIQELLDMMLMRMMMSKSE